MNLLGKIFTLLIFLMSIVFLVVALMVGASDRAWKQKAIEMNAKAQAAEASRAGIQASTQRLVKTLERERVARALQLSNLQSQLKQSQDQLAQIQTQLGASQDASQKRLDELEKANARVAQQDAQLAQLKDQNKKLVDDLANQFQKARNLQTQINEQKSAIASLEKDQADLANQLAKSQKVMKMLGVDENYNTAHIPAKVESVVTSVDDDGLFSVELGEDDGIRVGHQLVISRGSQYVGTGKVIMANDNKSIVQSVEGLMKAEVRRGDNVSTKL